MEGDREFSLRVGARRVGDPQADEDGRAGPQFSRPARHCHRPATGVAASEPDCDRARPGQAQAQADPAPPPDAQD